MQVNTKTINPNRFLINRSDLTNKKLFVEFYLPEYQELLTQLNNGLYPLKPIKEVCKRIFAGPFGSNRTVDMYQDSGIPYMRVKDVLPGKIEESGLTFISPEKHKELSSSRVVPGNVLVTIAGRLGTTAVFPERLIEGNITGHIVGLELNKEINPHYFSHYMNSLFGDFQVTRWGHRTTRPELNLAEIGEILITVPPRDIQDRIAKIMQDAYTTRQAKLTQAQQLLGGVEQYVLDQLEIPNSWPENERHFLVRQSQIHRADVRYFSPLYSRLEKLVESTSYETKTLNEVCQKITSGLTPSRKGYTPNGHTVLKVASLTRDWRINWDKVAFTSKKFFDKAKKAHIHEGDLLLLSASHQLDYIGRSFALVHDIPDKYQKKCMTVGELIIVRANRSIVLPEFLLACFSLQPIQALVNRMTRGQSAHLYASDLKELALPIPPLTLQKNILHELNRRRDTAQKLRFEAENIVNDTKAKVERLILGEAP